jgi:hypothetical protein
VPGPLDPGIYFFEVPSLDLTQKVIMATAIIIAKVYAEKTRRKFMITLVHISIFPGGRLLCD